jgi:hypothetical protein
VVGTVEQGGLDPDERVAGQHAVLHGVLDAVVDDGMYSRGMRPPVTLLENS